MTTIAYRAGVLASDSRETVGEEIIRDDATKIHRLPDGSLYAGAHTSEQIELVRLAVLKGEELPDHLDEPIVLKVLHDDLPHKTEVGGVALNLHPARAYSPQGGPPRNTGVPSRAFGGGQIRMR